MIEKGIMRRKRMIRIGHVVLNVWGGMVGELANGEICKMLA